MKRRDFIKNAGLAVAAAATTVNAPAVLAKKTYRWKMVNTWPAGLDVRQKSCERLAERIGELSGGRLQIQVFPSGKLVPGLKSFQAVSDGIAEAGSGASYFWAEKEPAAQWFAAVPFGMNAQGMSAWFHGGDGLKLWEETYAPFNLIPRPGGSTGVHLGGWFNKKINRIKDFKGLKISISGMGGRVIAKTGGNALQTAEGKIYTSLDRRDIDAAVSAGPLHGFSMGFYQVAKYCYYPGWQEPGTYLEYFFNKKAYESLPVDLQKIVDSACMENEHWVLAQFDALNAAALQTLINEHDVSVVRFPDTVLEALKPLADDVREEAAAKSVMATKVNASFKKFQKEVGAWGSISEKAYYNDVMPEFVLKT